MNFQFYIMWNFITTEAFWLITSIVILLFMIYKPFKNMLLKKIDEKIFKIEQDLMEARKLKNEAYDNLVLMREKYKESLFRYQELLAKAQEEYDVILNQAKEKVIDIADKGELLLKEHEKQQTHRIIQTFKDEVIVSVLSIVETELLDKMSHNDQMNIIESNRKTFKKIWH